MTSWTDKVVVVTGGAAGIGLAVTQRFYDAGARVVVADIENADKAARSMDGARARVFGLEVDVASEDSVRRMADFVEREFGRCDVLVNNAGIATGIRPRPFMEIPIEEWRKVYDVNVFGIFRCCRALTPLMQRAGGGRIVNIGSAAAFKGIPFLLHYVSSKGAVLALTRGLAKELGAQNILVNSVAPGFTITESVQGNKEQMEKTRAMSLQGRSVPREQFPSDLVGAVFFLASEDASFVTGQTLVVDGGTYMH